MKTFKANRKGIINYILVIFLILPLVFCLLVKETFIKNPFILIPLLSPLALMLWIYFDTFYRIENEQLYYRSGFLRGKIDISKISEITKGKTMWSGIKPALAQKGLIIKFNRFNKIYISPENNDLMITDLLKINPEILIKE